MSTLIEELERAADYVDMMSTGCSGRLFALYREHAARLRQRAAWVRELEPIHPHHGVMHIVPCDKCRTYAAQLALYARLTGPDIPAAGPSLETGTAAVPTPGKRRIPPRFEASAVEEIVFEMPPLRTNSVPAGPAPEPVKPPATCETCRGRGAYINPTANVILEPADWITCSACDGTGRTPAAGTALKGEK